MSLARHHAEWLSLVEVSGPFLSMPVLLRVFPQGLDAHDPDVARGLRLAFEEWEDNQGGLRPDPAIHGAWVRHVLREVLEIPDETLAEGQSLPPGLEARIAEHGETLRPDLALVNPGGASGSTRNTKEHEDGNDLMGDAPSPISPSSLSASPSCPFVSFVDDPDARKPRLLLQVVPAGQDLDKPLNDHRWKASPATRMMELLHATGVRLGLVTNGERWMLVDAPRGETTGFASWYASLWLEEPVTLRAFRSLLGARRFFGVAGGDTIEALLAESSQDQQEVTDRLGYQVRKAVEVLVQAIDRIDKDRGRALLAGVDEKGLYEAALTIMMRLVFLFSAEERGLLLLGDPLYDQHYAVSPLRAQLREAADQLGEEVLERRCDAWSRLLATFRAVYGGVQHDAMRLPAYGGNLFDPDRFPFLEGRAPGTAWRDTPAAPLPIHNRTVLHLLEALQMLQVKVPGGGPAEARRLSFRALDIEQIGHVYEGLLDHTAVRAEAPVLGLQGTGNKEPEVPLETLETLHAKGDDALIRFLTEATGRTPSALAKALASFGQPNATSLHGQAPTSSPATRPLMSVPEAPDESRRPPAPVPEGSDESRRLPTSVPEGPDEFSPAIHRWEPEAHISPVPEGRLNGLTDTSDPHLDLVAPRQPAKARVRAALANRPVRQSTDPLVDQRLRAACDNDPALYVRVRPLAALLRLDTAGYPVVINAGSIYVTQGDDRRATGTHYTPRSLTEPIVQHTLDPLVYDGPAEGRPKEDWRLKPARSLLDLKVCDLAMGSGAFLVQACRYLSERLVEAWEAAESAAAGRLVVTPEGDLATGAPDERPIPRDPEERLAIARRLVADRCLYGVDKNPMAVEMAKLSLWLITMQKSRPFTFLDHALKCGDSLLGVDMDQLRTWSLDRTGRGTLDLFVSGNLKEAIGCRTDLAWLPERGIDDIRMKERLHRQAEAAMARLKLAGDLILAPFFGGDKPQDQKKERERLQSYWVALPTDENDGQLRARAGELLEGRRPFHWPLEFPEVFLDGEGGGFDAIVGNPPFRNGKLISGDLGKDYREFLVEHLASHVKGHADLCAYFFLHARRLVRHGGGFGMLATKTIAQGDTREVGLDQLLNDGCIISRAVPSRRWPGAASVEVAQVWVRRGRWGGPPILDDLSVEGITPFLTIPGLAEGRPNRLATNANKSFIGSFVLGMGFVLTPEEARAHIAKDHRNHEVLFPYLSGEDLNSRFDQSSSRWVINFRDWPLERAQAYPDCWRIIEEKVKPERQRKTDSGEYALRKPLPQRYWHYGDKRPALYSAIADVERTIALTLHTKYAAFAVVPTNQVFSHGLTVLGASSDPGLLPVLCSSLHELWAFQYGSSLGQTLRYTPSDCFETFPFPFHLAGLMDNGEAYHTHRQAVMHARQEGLTKTYNRFHNPAETAADIARLRKLHVEMDHAVAAAYGWTDLDLGHGFHETKQGLRFTISEPARREVLGRLLRLNHERYAEEVAQGLHEKGRKRAKASRAPRRQKAEMLPGLS